MIIKLGRSGGFAGIRRPPQVLDTTQLDQSRSAALHELVQKSGFFDLPAEILPARPMPDSFQYAVTVEDGSRAHTVTTTENAAPQPLRALLHAVQAELRNQSGAAPSPPS